MSSLNDISSDLSGAGFDENEINAEIKQQAQELIDAGFTTEEVAAESGIVQDDDERVIGPIKQYWQSIANETKKHFNKDISNESIMGVPISELEEAGQKVKKDFAEVKEWSVGSDAEFGEYWSRGMGKSNINLALQYHTKGGVGIDVGQALSAEPEDTGHIERWWESVSAITGDLPFYVSAAIAGNKLSGGNKFATGFAAGYVNDSIKHMYLEALQRDEVGGFKDWWKLYVDHGIKEGLKSGVILGTAMQAPKTLGLQSSIIGNYATQYVAFTGMGALLEQKMPTKNELINTALVLGTFAGIEGTVKSTSMVLNRVKRTNKSPAEVVGEILLDPKKMEDVASRNIKEFRDEVVPAERIEPFVEGSKPAIPVAGEKGQLKDLSLEAVEPTQTPPIKTPTIKMSDFHEAVVASEAKKPVKIEPTIEPAKPVEAAAEAKELKDTVTETIDAPVKAEATVVEPTVQMNAKTEARVVELETKISQILEAQKDRANRGLGLVEPRKIDIRLKSQLETAQKELSQIKEPPLAEAAAPLDTTKVGNVAPEVVQIATSDAVNTVIGRIQFDVPQPKRSFGEVKADFITMFFDKAHPVFQLVKRFEEAGGQTGAMNPYTQLRIQPGMIGRAMHMIQHGTLDFKTLKTNGRGLGQILESINTKAKFKEFSAYAVSKRALEKSSQGKETGVPVAEAQAVVKSLESVYEPIFREMVDFQNRVVTYLKDSGIISEKDMKLMLEANRDFVPFYRVLDEGVAASKAQFGQAVKNPFKKFKGSERKIINPIESVYLNTIHHVKIAERNKTFVDLIEMVEKMPEVFPEISRSAAQVKATKIEVKEMEAAFDAPIKPEFAEGMTVFRREHGIVGKSEIAIFRNGKREIWEVGEQVVEALRDTSRGEANMLLRVLAVPARLLRAGATLAPDFMVRNYMRDTTGSAVTSQRDFKPFIDSWSGFFHIIKQDKAYQDFMKSGGMQSMVVSMDRNYFQRDIQKYLTAGKVRNIVTQPIETLRVLSEVFEGTTRIGVQKLAAKEMRRDTSLTEREVIDRMGFEGRDVSIDFAKMGSKIHAVNMLSSFFNARLQGYARIAKSFKEDPKGTSLKIFKYIVAPSVLLWFANKDDPRYKQLPAWQKDMFWIIITPEIGIGDKISKDDNDHTIYRIPKPFELGLLFGSGVERILTATYEADPEPLTNFIKDLTTSNATGLVPIPDVAKPAIEAFSNKNLFNNTPIIPYGSENMLPEYQYNEYTSETAKVVGKAISEITGGRMGSPARLDQLISNWTGTLGRYTIQTLDYGLRESGIVKTPEKPEFQLEDLPVIKAFLVRDATGSSEYIQRFYQKYKKAEGFIKTLDKLEREERLEEIPELLRKSDLDLLVLRDAREAMSAIREIIRTIYMSDMDTIEKRQLIDDAYQSMIDIARMSLEGLKEVKQN